MTLKQFVKEFIKWRKENNYPKRQDCRDLFKMFTEADKKLKDNGVDDVCGFIGNPNEIEKGTERPFWIDFIKAQEKPSIFLDNLFKKGSAVTENDPSNRFEVKEKLTDEDVKKIIIDSFYNYVKEHGEVPEFRALNTGYKINKYFSSVTDLLQETKLHHDLSKYILNEYSFGDEYAALVAHKVAQYKRFIITTAVSGKKVNKGFVNSIKNYCDKNNSLCLILPCEDVANRKSDIKWQLDPELSDFLTIYKDAYLNNNVYVSNIKVSAKQIHPTTGLPQFTQDGTAIIASPKQDLSYIPNSPNRMPHAIMTTGCITEADYDNDLFMSQRLSKIAEFDHIMGAIIVEIEDDKIFHFRQIQMDANGSFCDLGYKYTPEGYCEEIFGSAMVLGDSHFGEHDEDILVKEKEMIKELGIDTIVLHDIFTASSITHHDKNKTLTRAIKANENKISLAEEANESASKLIEMLECVNGEVIVANSNHHEHVERYIEEGRYALDATNLGYSLDIVKAFISGHDPFKYMMCNMTDIQYINDDDYNRLIFLGTDEDKKIYDIEVSQHGHRGANGAKGNLRTYRKAFKKSISAHTHTPAIEKGAWSVGTSSLLKLGYNKGLSSWVHACAIIYPNGTRQLINLVKNQSGQYKWRLED